ncbi:MAG: AlpA family transcriptional regulator, partial [Haemophilus parainfluenzae]
MKLIKLSQVMAKTTLSKSTIYRLIKTSDFPLPKKLSLRAVAWLETEIDEWIVNRGCACNSSSNHSISTLQAYLLNFNNNFRIFPTSQQHVHYALTRILSGCAPRNILILGL